MLEGCFPALNPKNSRNRFHHASDPTFHPASRPFVRRYHRLAELAGSPRHRRLAGIRTAGKMRARNRTLDLRRQGSRHPGHRQWQALRVRVLRGGRRGRQGGPALPGCRQRQETLGSAVHGLPQRRGLQPLRHRRPRRRSGNGQRLPPTQQRPQRRLHR